MPFIPPAQKLRQKPVSKPEPKQNEAVSSQQAETLSAAGTITAPTKPLSTNKTEFSERVGVEAMHELVTNLVSTIFYMRDIVPVDSFEDIRLQINATYHDDGSEKKAATQLPIKLLKKGISPEVDEVLGWLDFGFVDALNRKYLRSMMIIVYLSEENRQKAVETYTMNFGYDGDVPFVELSDQMGQLNVSSRHEGAKDKITKASFGKALRKMIRELLTVSNRMPRLPSDVVFDFRFFYQDDTPASYQPPAFEPDLPEEVYLASHGADQPPMTYEFNTTASTGHQGMACQIASVAHYLPPTPDADTDAQDYMDEVMEDEASRDVIWPVEKSIYGRVSSTTLVESSQIESLQVEQSSLAGFCYPLGQILESGEIKAIETGNTRWSDPIEGGRVWKNSSKPDRPTTMSQMLQVVRQRKSGYEGWSQLSDSQLGTQIGGRDLSQQQTDTQVPTPMASQVASSQVKLSHVTSSSASNAARAQGPSTPDADEVIVRLDVDVDMGEPEEVLPMTQEAGELSPSASRNASSGDGGRSSSSRSTQSKTTSSEDFDPIRIPEPTIPALQRPKRRASMASLKSQTSVSNAGKSKPVKRTKSIATKTKTAVKSKGTTKPKAPRTTTAKKTPQTGLKPTSKPVIKPVTKPVTKPRAKKAVSPVNLAQAQAQAQAAQSASETVEDPITTFTQSQEPTASNAATQRHHPYRRPSSLALSITPDQAQQTARSAELSAPRTHFKRVRSSRGIKGMTYEEMMAALPVISEEAE